MGLHPQTGHDDDPTATLWQRAVDQQSSRETYCGGIIGTPDKIFFIKKKRKMESIRSAPLDTPTHFTTRNYSKWNHARFIPSTSHFWSFSIPKKNLVFLPPQFKFPFKIHQQSCSISIKPFSNRKKKTKIKMTMIVITINPQRYSVSLVKSFPLFQPQFWEKWLTRSTHRG